MSKPPLIFHIFYGFLILAKPWYPLIIRKLDKQPGLKGTMEPRLMETTIDATEKPPIWIHAVSVGEVEAALPIARRVIESYGSEKLLMTVTTKEGFTVAKNKLENLKYIQSFNLTDNFNH